MTVEGYSMILYALLTRNYVDYSVFRNHQAHQRFSELVDETWSWFVNLNALQGEEIRRHAGCFFKS